MPVLVALALAALPIGAVTWAVVRRWPQVDPGSPDVAPALLEAEVRRRRALRALLRRRLQPGELTGLLLSVAVATVVAGGAAVGIVLAMVRRREGLADLDLSAARFGAENATALSTSVLRVVTDLGSTMVVVALAVVVAVVEHRRRPDRAVFGFLVLVIGGQALITNATKLLVARARPDLDPLSGFSGPSFPSGHSAAAAASLAAFALLLGRGRPLGTKAVLAALAVGGTAAVAATRVLLGVHWLTDVVAGVALGWSWFALCSIAFGGRLLRFGAPVEAALEEEAAREEAEEAGPRPP